MALGQVFCFVFCFIWWYWVKWGHKDFCFLFYSRRSKIWSLDFSILFYSILFCSFHWWPISITITITVTITLPLVLLLLLWEDLVPNGWWERGSEGVKLNDNRHSNKRKWHDDRKREKKRMGHHFFEWLFFFAYFFFMFFLMCFGWRQQMSTKKSGELWLMTFLYNLFFMLFFGFFFFCYDVDHDGDD